MRKKRFIQGALALAASILLLAAFYVFRPLPSAGAPSASSALLEASAALDEYVLSFVLDEDENTLSCSQQITYTHQGDEPLSSLCLRTYANAMSSMETSPANTMEVYVQTYGEGVFSSGGLEIHALTLDEEDAAWAYENEDQSLLRISLPRALEKGQQASLSMEYTVVIPECAFSFGRQGNWISLENVFPVIAVGGGDLQHTDSWYPIGDVNQVEMGNWTVYASLPKGWSLAGGAADESGAMRALGSRGFSAVLMKGGFVASALCSDTCVRVYAQSKTGARRALRSAIRLFESLENTYGDYPWPTLDIVEVSMPMDAALCPQMTLVRSLSDENLAFGLSLQWFGGIAANDGALEPWLSDGLASYAAFNALKAIEGVKAYEKRMDALEVSMLVTLDRNLLISSPCVAFMNFDEYEMIIRERCALMLHHLCSAMGEDALNAALRAYLSANAFSLCTRSDFAAALGSSWQGFLDDYLDSWIGSYY